AHQRACSRYLRNRGSGSRACHAVTSASARYREGSSLEEWGPMRYVTASTSVGPSPSRALRAASRVARYTARASIPSTRTPSNPYAFAFSASVAEAVCFDTGTEIAHWLLLHRKTVGARKTPAKFIATWKSAVLVAPSPKNARTAFLSPSSFMAHPIPTACGSCVPTGDEIER